MTTGSTGQPTGEAIPLPEQGATGPKYVPSPEVEALTPKEPEVLQASSMAQTSQPRNSFEGAMVVVPPPPGAPEGIGGILLMPDALNDPNMRGVMDELSNASQYRTPSRELFKRDTEQPPDESLLKQLVTNQRMRELWHHIDELQEDVLKGVRADRTSTDAYQQDLLYASALLLQTPANYDDARQIVYRVRGDLARERKVVGDITRYRPRLILYYSIWFVLVLFLSRLDPQFRAMMPDTLPILKLAFPPILFAILGALFNGIMALMTHTSTRRDYDPIYNSWYLINPLVGGLLGLVVFIFFVVTGTSFTPELVSDPNVTASQAPLVIWLLAFIVGWQQNTAVNLLNGFLKTVSSASNANAGGETAQQTRPVTPTPSTATTPPSSSTTAKG